MRLTYSTAATLIAALLLAGSQAAAQTSIAKVAIANPARIFNDIQETRDLKAKMENDRKTLEATDLEKRTKIRDLQTQRDALRPDSPQYNEINRQLLQAGIDYETWRKITELDIQRQQKLQMKSLFDKITASVTEVATQKGIDLVIAEQHPDFPENIDQLSVDQVRLLINQRNVLFNTALVDISSDVIAAMDTKYKSGR